MSFFGGAQERLAFVLQLDDRGAVRAFGQLRVSAERNLGEVDNRLDRIGTRMQVVGAGAVGFAGIAGRALFGFAQASEEAEAQSRKLDQALATAPQLAGASRDAFEELADRLQDTTTAEGDAVIGLEGFLGTLGRTEAEILELTPLVVDFATRYGLDFEAAGRLVNTAVEGNTSRLERLIGTMGEGETVTEALRRSVGGFAEREAQSLSGQLTILKNNLGDISEGIGAGVVDAFNSVAGPASSFVNTISEADPALLAATGRVAAFGTAGIGAVGGLSLLAGTVLRMRDRFTTLDIDGTTRRINGFGRAAQVAGGVAGVGALVLGLYELNAASNQLTVDLPDLNDVVEESGDQAAAAADLLRTFGHSIEEQAEVIAEQSVPAAERWIDALERNAAAFGISADELAAARQAVEDKRAADAQATRDQEDYSDSVAEGAEALDEETGATERNAAATRDATEAVNRHREAIEARTQAKNDELDATLAQLDAEIAHRQAERDTAQAYSELNAAITEHGEESVEAAEATDNAAEAALRQASAAGDLAIEVLGLDGAVNEANVRQGVMRQELQNIADSLAPGSPLRAQLQGFIDQLGALDERQIEVDILANYGLSGSGIPLTRTTGARAKGGPVSAGKAYLVGEEGPEVVVPGSSGTVIPNDQLGGGIVQHITINGEPDDFTKARMARELRRAAEEAWRKKGWGLG